MTLDTICGQTTNPTLLNALHACRPDHPWNKTAVRPFYAAWFLAMQQPIRTRLSSAAELWLEKKAIEEAGL